MHAHHLATAELWRETRDEEILFAAHDRAPGLDARERVQSRQPRLTNGDERVPCTPQESLSLSGTALTLSMRSGASRFNVDPVVISSTVGCLSSDMEFKNADLK
jgi:hypothetical protein